MIKGVNRRIIEVCDENNAYFERMLLFVRPEMSDEGDVLKTQISVLSDTLGRPCISAREKAARDRRRRRKGIVRSSVWCGLGALAAVVLQMIF